MLQHRGEGDEGCLRASQQQRCADGHAGKKELCALGILFAGNNELYAL